MRLRPQIGYLAELGNSVLEINHVTNVTKVLNETTASDRVSRSARRYKHLRASQRVKTERDLH